MELHHSAQSVKLILRLHLAAKVGLKGRGQARQFRQCVRELLNRIKATHGENATLHVFPAMPVALAVDFGRIVMPKADLKLQLYDQNRSLGGFAPALAMPQL